MVGDILVAVPCNLRSCSVCGPRIRGEQTAHLLKMLGGRPLYRLVMGPGRRWQSLRERIAAEDEYFVRCPTTTSAVVLTTLALGERVPPEQVESALAEALAAIPCGGKVRLSTSASWAWHPAPKEVVTETPTTSSNPGPGGGKPKEITYGFGVSVKKLLAITTTMFPGAVVRIGDVRDCPRWRLDLPDEGTPERRRWALAVGRFDASDQKARKRAVARPRFAMAS
jgi:hypothetical protein